jgi:tetratricopeptide (TPR) repeat protein
MRTRSRRNGVDDFYREERNMAATNTHVRTGWQATGWRTTDARRALAECERLERFSKEQRKLIRRATDLNREAVALWRGGKFADAVNRAKTALEIRKGLLGEAHPDYAASLNILALVYKAKGDYALAEPLYRRAAEIDRQALGEEHPNYATDLGNLGEMLISMGDYARAEPLLRQTADIFKQALGENDPRYAVSLNNLALLYQATGNYAKAEPLMRRAVAITRGALGEKHLEYANRLNNLAMVYYDAGDFAKAEPLLRRTADIFERAHGENHPDYATVLNNLAELHYESGEYARAEFLHRRAANIRKWVLGETQADYAQSLNNLAKLYLAMGDYAKAEPLFQQAAQIRKQSLGATGPDYATSLKDLAALYEATRDFARADTLYRQAADIYRQALGDKHPYYSASLNNLAGLYHSMGDYAKAEPLYRQALEINKQALGEKHYKCAIDLNNLAALCEATGDNPKAELLYRQAADIFKQELGEKHPHYTACSFNLARLYWRMDRLQEAGPLLRDSVDRTRALLDVVAAGQSERQQLVMAASLRVRLDSYFSFLLQHQGVPDEAYGAVLAAKGAALARRRLARAGDRETARLADDLRRAATELATRALAPPPEAGREAWIQKLNELGETKEHLEQELALRSPVFRAKQSLKNRTPAEVRAALPDNAVLVDVLEYVRYAPPLGGEGEWQAETRLAVFVLRKKESTVLLDLGPVKPVAEAAEAWRKQLAWPGTYRSDDRDTPAARLRKTVWDKLEPHLGECKLVLLSPDGPLCQLPLAALPGREPETYLVQERAFAVLPVPQLLPELVTTPAPGAPSLLILGDVDYGAPAGNGGDVVASRTVVRGDRAGAVGGFYASESHSRRTGHGPR